MCSIRLLVSSTIVCYFAICSKKVLCLFAKKGIKLNICRIKIENIIDRSAFANVMK